MSDDTSLDDEKFLAFVVEGWSKQRAEVVLDANACWVGKQIGLTDAETKLVVELLVRKGLLHAHNVHGVILVHPTTAALDQQKPVCMGLLAHSLRLLFGSRSKNKA